MAWWPWLLWKIIVQYVIIMKLEMATHFTDQDTIS